MKFTNTFAQHAQNPAESVEQYYRRKRIDLAREIRGAKKIYLDTKYWIWFRDVRLGRPRSSEVSELLGTIETLVRQKKALCPISVDTYAEVFKQSDLSTLRATVELIDELSIGVSMLEMGERIKLEVVHFIYEKTKGPDAVHPLDDLVWTKLAYVLGFVTPTVQQLSDDENRLVQKAFVDQMWVVTLTDMFERMGSKGERGRPAWYPDDVADALNAGKFSHMHEYSSFKQLFQNELAGILDEYKPTFEDLMRHIYESEYGWTPTQAEVEKAEAGRYIANLIYNAFHFNKIKAELPSFRVSAGLHAAIRWDPKRKFRANDLHDIHHAVAAVPYCDWFFTERSLRHLVGETSLGFSSLFKCITVSEVGEALSLTRQLTTL